MASAIRSCAGGVVFCDEQVFLLMSDRGEWVMPKGVIRNRNHSNDVALWRVEDEAGIHARIIGIAGNTRYDFFSESRGKEGFLYGGYYPVQKAREMLTHDCDRQILDTAYQIYTECKEGTPA